MSLDADKAVRELVKARLAAIPSTTVNGYPVSPIIWSSDPAATTLFFERRRSNAPLPHGWWRVENVAQGRPSLGVEYFALASFDAWCRNREEVEAIRRAMMFLDGYVVGAQGVSGVLAYSLNAANVLTEESAQHLSMVFGCTYLEARVVA